MHFLYTLYGITLYPGAEAFLRVFRIDTKSSYFKATSVNGLLIEGDSGRPSSARKGI